MFIYYFAEIVIRFRKIIGLGEKKNKENNYQKVKRVKEEVTMEIIEN
jgi:hypothetical protein